MNKLVSKDPILRFKLGKKKVKVDTGRKLTNMYINLLTSRVPKSTELEPTEIYSNSFEAAKALTGNGRILNQNPTSVHKFPITRTTIGILRTPLTRTNLDNNEANDLKLSAINYLINNLPSKVAVKDLKSIAGWDRSSGQWIHSKSGRRLGENERQLILTSDGKFYYINGNGSLSDAKITKKEETREPSATSVETPVQQNPKASTRTSTRTTPYNSKTAEWQLKLYDAKLLKLEGNMRNGKWDGIWGKNTEAAYQTYLAKQSADEAIAKMKESKFTPNVTEPTVTSTQPVNFGYRSNFNYTNGNIKNLGFNNYQGLVDYVRTNPNNPFSLDLIARWGDVNTWNLLKFENAYRIGGHYGNMNMRRLLNGLASWAGENDARYDAREAAYGRQINQPQPYNDSWKQALNLSFYRKQGGQLVSKNPVKRFKLNKNKT